MAICQSLRAKNSPNQRAEVQIILSNSLNAQQVADLANRYAIEIMSVTFKPYDPTTGERFGTGFLGVGARYGPLQERFAWLESRHFQYLSRQNNLSNGAIFLREKQQLLKSKIPYFELILYGTYAQLNDISQAPEVKVAVVRKEVSSDKYTNYQRRLQADKVFQEGLLSGRFKPSTQTGGSTGSDDSSTLFQPVKFSNSDSVHLFSPLPEAFLHAGSTPAAAKRILAQSLVCSSLGSSTVERCPPDNTWLSKNDVSFANFVVYPYDPAIPTQGVVYGNVGSSFFFPSLTAFQDLSQPPCLPAIQPDLSFTPACVNNGVYVANSSYEHEHRIYNPACILSGTTGCFIAYYAYTLLPATAYFDTPVLDTSTTFNPTIGTIGTLPSIFFPNITYSTYVEFYSTLEDLTRIDDKSVTIAGQVGTDFGLTFNPPFNVYAIDTTNIASQGKRI